MTASCSVKIVYLDVIVAVRHDSLSVLWFKFIVQPKQNGAIACY